MHDLKKDNNQLEIKNNQNCQKIELYGSPTTKELKKKNIHPDWQEGWRWAAGMERTLGKGAARDQDIPHLHEYKLGGTVGEQDRPRDPGFQCGKLKPQNLWL